MDERDQDREAWLAATLPGEQLQVAPASSDASFRRYFRVHHAGTHHILMDAPPPQEDCNPFVQVTSLLAGAGVNVPEVVAADLERGFLLLGDLGDRLYLDELTPERADTLYGDALTTLVRLQRDGDASALPAYDEARLRDEMALFPQWFVARHLNIEPDTRASEVLEHAFVTLIDACLEQPQVLVHRDYHSRNLMVTERHNPGVLDYQDAVRGPVTYDLVSLLRDVYIEWPDETVYRWVARWQTLAEEAGVIEPTDAEAVRRWFDLTGVQRHLKVAGIFARLWYRDGKSRYLADIPLTLGYLTRVAARRPELAALADWLADLDVIGRNADATAALDVGEPA